MSCFLSSLVFLFKSECIDEEEDETLVELARVLATFLDFIGGKAYASKLFKILELLLVLDELPVRKEAVMTFKSILSQLNPADFESELMDLITKLGSNEYMNQKQSAINLIPSIYLFVGINNKTTLVK